MLHNTGQYTNDVPIMNGQTNLTSMSERLNIDSNINNLSKIVHEPPQATSHFNIPDYGGYGLNMNANLGHFQYHSMGFQPAQSQIHNGWQNNMLPMNLNTHVDHTNSYHYNKESLNQYKDLPINKGSPQVQTKAFHKQLGMDNFDIPNYKYADYNLHLSPKSKLEQELRNERNNLIEKSRIVTPSSFYLEQNLDLSSKRDIPMNNFARPYQESNSITNKEESANIDLSLKRQNDNESPVTLHQENTHNLSQKTDEPSDYNLRKTQKVANFDFVNSDIKSNNDKDSAISQKIEEPLNVGFLNLSKSQKQEYPVPFTNSNLGDRFLKDQDSRRRSLENTVKMIENILSHTSNTRKKINSDTNNKIINSDSQSNDSNSKSSNYESESNDSSQDTSYDNNTSKEIHNDNKKCNNTNDKNNESDNEDVKPSIVNKNNESEIDHSIIVKVEVIPNCVDLEYLNPFHHDIFGVKQEDIMGSDVIDSESSVNVAKEVVRNGAAVQSAYFECPHCFLYFKHPKRFLIHTKWHSFGLTNDKRMEMQKEKQMRRNMKREARAVERMKTCEVTDVNSPGRKFGCKDCDKVFTTKASLKNHRQRYHPARSRDCKICGKTIGSWNALRQHITTHTSEAGYQCSDCPKRFKHLHSLAKHRDTHLEKTHGCEQCPKKFGSAALLNVHMKTHERMLRGATFRCTYCAKGFFESYSLQVHERTHRNERPYLCEICNTSFGTNSSLKRHLKVSHSTSKPYECSTCHRSFISEAIRDRHAARNHGDPEHFKFVCSQCPCKYLKMKDLRKHVYKAHPKGRRKKKHCSDSE